MKEISKYILHKKNIYKFKSILTLWKVVEANKTNTYLTKRVG